MEFISDMLKHALLGLTLMLLSMETNAQNNMNRKELLNAVIGDRTISSVKIVEIEFSAGQKAPYHKHPCPVVGTIIAGTCLVQVEGKEPQILKAGDAFYEPADTPIVHFDNYSETEPMRFVAYYLSHEEKELTEILQLKK